MRNILIIFLLCGICAACNQNAGNSTNQKPGTDSQTHALRTMGGPDSDQAFIVIDSANKMISSYLNSIEYQSNDSELRSVIIDADALRTYLNGSAGHNISHMKIMFAHTLDYINSGGANTRCGYKSGALTFVLAGYNDQGNYIYYKGNSVLDNGLPCPHLCDAIGQAQSDLLPQP